MTFGDNEPPVPALRVDQYLDFKSTAIIQCHLHFYFKCTSLYMRQYCCVEFPLCGGQIMHALPKYHVDDKADKASKTLAIQTWKSW
jgi:hypothetical protein